MSTITVTAGGGFNNLASLVNTGAQIGQIIELATGSAPSSAQLANWQAYENAGGSLSSIASAFVASTAFANLHNGGALVDPDSPIAAAIVSSIIDQTQGSHTASQLSAWVGTGLSTTQVFQEFALGDQFTAATAAENALPLVVFAKGAQTVTLQNIAPDKTSILFENATTETLAHPAGSNQVDVSSAGTAADAINLAVANASASQSGDLIPANTGVIDWFDFGGNTYIVEATDPLSSPVTQTTLSSSDTVVEIVGSSLDLSGAQLSGHALSL
jgi:hypothetical protein